MTFKNAVLNTPEVTTTTNGMKAYKSTLNACTDLFFKIGASRGKDILKEFEKAYLEDREVALRIAQWARDARGGAGERKLYRDILLFLEKNYKNELMETNLLNNIAEIGRWDDLLIFNDPDVRNDAFSLIAHALDARNGLCAKWMPRKGPISIALRTFLGWTPKYYRKRLVELTKVVETEMCSKEWNSINFSHVPSLAMSRYSKAFGRNAPDHFTAYKEALKKGDPSVKVNAGAVYPYDIVKNLRHGDSDLADQQWEALPNFMGDSKVLPLVDVSGSMTCKAGNGKLDMTCLDVAVSLGMYCASKNTGDFKDLFLTFTSRPQFVHLRGTLSARYRLMSTAKWEMSTNLESAFNEILKVAMANKVSPEDMPSVLLIMSDMQFDSAVGGYRRGGYNVSAMEMIARKYEVAGYKIPGIVFWNLDSHDNVPARFDERGVALVSGFSPAIMKAVLSSNMDDMTPQGVMLKAVNNDRYAI